jgi:hypothetical protein
VSIGERFQFSPKTQTYKNNNYYKKLLQHIVLSNLLGEREKKVAKTK